MKVHQDFPLKDILFYKIGGTAKVVLEVKSEKDIIEAFQYIRKHKIEKFLVVGLGSNMVMHDKTFDGAIVWITKSKTPYIKMTDDGLVEAYGGQTLDDLIQFMFAHKLRGIEALGGLPSTVGGAIRGNAGAFGVEMKNVVEKVAALDVTTGLTRIFSTTECAFAYRNSMFKWNHNLVVLKGYFRFHQASDEEIAEAKKVYQGNIEYREKNHPVEYPSCGSVFKNIKEEEQVAKIISVWPDIESLVREKWHGKVSMGYIVKRLGLQGLKIGGAKITEKHANYISNVDNAKQEDVMAIITQVKKKFHDTFGFYPELEAEVVA